MPDTLSRIFSLVGISMPAFWLGLLIIMFLYYQVQLLPAGGRLAPYFSPPPTVTGMYTIDSLLAGEWETFGAALGPSLVNAMIAIAVTMWPTYARLVRGETLSIKERTFIEAEKAIGTSKIRILVTQILPMCSTTTIIRATLDMGNVIRIAAGLSFLGLGAQAPSPDWGLMVSTGRSFMVSQWWVPTFPGLAILISVFGFNLLGDGIRDIADPHLRRGE